MFEKTVSHPSRWDLYREAGKKALATGDLAEAEQSFLIALEEARRHYPENDPRLATSLKHLGDLYHQMRRFGEALDFYRKAVAVIEKKLGAKSAALPGLLEGCAAALAAQGKKPEAAECAARARAIRELPVSPA